MAKQVFSLCLNNPHKSKHPDIKNRVTFDKRSFAKWKEDSR